MNGRIFRPVFLVAGRSYGTLLLLCFTSEALVVRRFPLRRQRRKDRLCSWPFIFCEESVQDLCTCFICVRFIIECGSSEYNCFVKQVIRECSKYKYFVICNSECFLLSWVVSLF